MVTQLTNEAKFPQFANNWGVDNYGLWFSLHIKSNNPPPINRYKYNSNPILKFRWCSSGVVKRDSSAINKFNLPIEIVINEGFWLSEIPINQKSWRYLMGSSHKSFYKGSNLPINNISSLEILDFIERIQNQFNNKGFALPTEEQWEYACRAGTETPYYWPEEVAKNNINYFNYESLLGEKPKIKPVFFYQPNGWGFFQMNGNVGEWVLANSLYAIKGGHYLNCFEDCTSSQRNIIDSNHFSHFLTGGKVSASGFRLVFNN